MSEVESNQIIKNLELNLEKKFNDNFTGLVLFGSYAKGQQNINSDLDVLLVFKKLPKNRREQFALVRDLIIDLEESYNIEINPILSEECNLETSFLMIDIAEYAKIIVDKNNVISNLFSEIKKGYEEGLFKKLIKGNSYVLKIEENV